MFNCFFLPPGIIDWVNGCNDLGEDESHPFGFCEDDPCNALPEVSPTTWDDMFADAITFMDALDFDSPPVPWSGNNLHQDLSGRPICPSWQFQSYIPKLDGLNHVAYEWCTDVPCADGGRAVFANFFEHASAMAGPCGGWRILMNGWPGNPGVGCGGIGFDVSNCTPNLPFLIGIKTRLTGYPSICQSIREFDLGETGVSTASCGSVAATGGHIILPRSFTALSTISYPSVPPPLDQCWDHSHVDCAWTDQACADCACP